MRRYRESQQEGQRGSSVLWPCLAVVLGSLAASCETQHDALARRAPAAGGANGTGGSAATAEGGVTGGTSAVARRDSGPPDADPDSSTTPSWTGEPGIQLMHGVVDADRIVFCVSSGSGARSGPIPQGGLQYGESVSLRAFPNLDLDLDDLTIRLVTGSAASDSDACDLPDGSTMLPDGAADEGDSSVSDGAVPDGAVPDSSLDASDPDAALTDSGGSDAADGASSDAGTGASVEPPVEPPLPEPDRQLWRSQQIAQIPAGSISNNSSTLWVVGGCFGGVNYVSSSNSYICGSDYAVPYSNLRLMVVSLSRPRSESKVGLQLFNASVATSQGGIVSRRITESAVIDKEIARNVVPGAIAPLSDLPIVSASGYFADEPASSLEVMLGSSGANSLSVAWSVALSQAGLGAIEDGENYVLVLMGPRPGFSAERWWNGSAVRLLRAL
ncbi:MAG: hypothetical protein HRU17_22150 [Polyangiaceae bacterium]|nr:hypothetical protein [Polyangiaceae bacterium]